ncbi:MAG TPA: hypothetical protein ENJ73_00520 [Desulfobacterales bacterium]|nr:hypothetical protein [Desulfobacterales bacterium]
MDNDGGGSEVATRRREATAAPQAVEARQVQPAPEQRTQETPPPAETGAAPAPAMELAAPPANQAVSSAVSQVPAAPQPATPPPDRTAEAAEQPQEPPPAERREERAVNQVMARQAAQQYTNASLQAQINRNQLDETV